MARPRHITDEQVDRAIDLLRTGTDVEAAAKATGMSATTLYFYLRERGLMAELATWRIPKPRRRPQHPQRRLTEAQRVRRDTVFAMRERGESFAAIGAELGVSHARAHQLWLAALADRGLEPPVRSSEADRDAVRARRGMALALREQGLSFAEMAAELGVTPDRARGLWLDALKERGEAPPVRQVATSPTERQVETRDQLARLQRAVSAGDLCGWCGRHLDDIETVYVDTLRVAVERGAESASSRDPVWLRAPIGIECASPALLAEVAGQDPEPCVVCRRGVVHRRTDARRKRTTCSRRCGYAYEKRSRKEAGAPSHA